MPRTRPQSLLLALAVAALLGTCGLTYAHRHHVRQLVANGQWRGPSSVEDVRARYEVAVVQRLGPELDRAGVAWPPKSMTLLAFKREQRVELWLGNGSHERRVKTYPVLAASGIGGPKTTRGDRQVPEGVYGLPALNPNSSFHLSIRVDYPNAEDHQVLSGDLGGDIFVHGRAVSIGCLAMGDPAIEELFVGDRLHLSDAGYRRWAEMLTPHLK